MKIETRINGDFQTIIPKHFVQKYELKEGDIVQWEEKEDGRILMSFKKSNIFSDVRK